MEAAKELQTGNHDIFQTFDRINHAHDELHRYVIHEIDRQLRMANDVPFFSYCWVEMGSGGRQERTLWTDQDNAIIYTCEEKDLPHVEEFLRQLAQEVVTYLSRIGYPLCEGLIMANNPRWFQSIEGWKKKWTQWCTGLSLDDIRYLLIAVDFRSIHGDHQLARKLKKWMIHTPPPNNWFPRLAAHSFSQSIPIGAFGNIFTPLHGECMGMYHLKEGGYYQLISFIRILSLYAGVVESSTKARITTLVEKGFLTKEEGRGWEKALIFFLQARLKHHIELLNQGEKLTDFVRLSFFSRNERKRLKEHLYFLKKQQKRWMKELGIKK
jgi:CBS domain-containing protein